MLKTILNYTAFGNDLFAEFHCSCPAKEYKDTGLADIMKTKIKLSGYNDAYFFNDINKTPAIISCVCGKKYSTQWKRSGVSVEEVLDNTEPAASPTSGKDFYFTFGDIHETLAGIRMSNRWVRVTAPDYGAARECFCREFATPLMGDPAKWSFQYEAENFKPEYCPLGEYEHLIATP